MTNDTIIEMEKIAPSGSSSENGAILKTEEDAFNQYQTLDNSSNKTNIVEKPKQSNSSQRTCDNFRKYLTYSTLGLFTSALVS